MIKLNVNTPINRASKYMKQKPEVKREVDKQAIAVGDFNSPFFVIVRTNRKSVMIQNS